MCNLILSDGNSSNSIGEPRSIQREQYFLCGRNRAYMMKFDNCSEKEKQYMLRYVSKPPPRNIIVCEKDKLKAIRY